MFASELCKIVFACILIHITCNYKMMIEMGNYFVGLNPFSITLGCVVHQIASVLHVC